MATAFLIASIAIPVLYAVGYGPALAICGYKYAAVDIPNWLVYPHLVVGKYSEAYYNYCSWWMCMGNPGMDPLPHQVGKMLLFTSPGLTSH